jgi:hypothetical protein
VLQALRPGSREDEREAGCEVSVGCAAVQAHFLRVFRKVRLKGSAPYDMASIYRLWLSRFVLLGAALLAIGLVLAPQGLSFLVSFVGQSGTPNPKILEKIRLVPALFVVTGAELLLVSGVWFLLRRRECRDATALLSLNARQQILAFLLATSWLIAMLSLNFGTLSLIRRLIQQAGRTDREIVAADFGEAYAVIHAVRENTPESAVILIKTRQPLQYLLNYELYPRRFYFYPDREFPVEHVSTSWLDHRQIGWILEVSNEDPLQFRLSRRKVAF